MSTPAKLLEVYSALERMHAWRGWHWWPDPDPFEVCVGCILVQNTSWTNVERALEQLMEAQALNPAAMGALSQEDLEALIRPSGQYRQKARKLREFLGLADRHGGLEGLLSLPMEELRGELLATWGIGDETADAMICYAAKQPAMVVDAYTARMFSRLGMGPAEQAGYRPWQQWMEGLVEPDRDLRARYHALVVMHCKHLCRKRAPKCGECELAGGCSVPGEGL